jgi:hypothetical protein
MSFEGSPWRRDARRGVAVFAALFVLLSSARLPAQSPDREADDIRPFVTDGCTMFPDGVPGRPTLWEGCCVAHDLAYWKGGTRSDRRQADATLMSCVNKASKNPVLGSLMRLFVMIGGGPERAGGSRWGYGWAHVRGYAPLTPEENKRVTAAGPPDLTVRRHGPPSRALPIPSETGDYCVDTAVSLLREANPHTELIATDGTHANGVLTMQTNVCRNPVRMRLAVETQMCREPRYMTSPLPIEVLQVQAAGADCASLVADATERISARRVAASGADVQVQSQKK